jgi:hypothetical protein
MVSSANGDAFSHTFSLPRLSPPPPPPPPPPSSSSVRSVSARATVAVLDTRMPIKSVAVSRDAQLVACGHAQGHVTIWLTSSMSVCAIEPVWLSCVDSQVMSYAAATSPKNLRSSTPIMSTSLSRSANVGAVASIADADADTHADADADADAPWPIHMSSLRKEVRRA